MVAILSNQREAILDAVRSMYTDVARSPEQSFHFPTGRSACVFVGYPEKELQSVPETALESFAGVGYPFAVGAIEPGDTVLDIGSGSGTDALIAARLVGPSGRVYGLDMTEAMIEKLERTARTRGIANLELLRGNAEALPLPDESVDVVTSNGVLNLVPDKARCIAEIFRVLKPGGYVQIADVVLEEPATEECRLDPKLWAECVVGATLEASLLEMFREAGFEARILGRMDYFSGSDSTETRSVARSLGARSMLLEAAKPPLGHRVPRATPWPRAQSFRALEPESVTAPEPEPVPEPAEILNASGIECGMLEPLMKVRMRGLETGQVLEVRSDEPSARVGIPSWSRLTGNTLIATRQGTDGTIHYFLRRK